MELSQMPVELLSEIFIQLRDYGLWNLLPAALVSRRLYMLVTPLIYDSIRIDASEYTYIHSQTKEPKRIKQPLHTLITRLSAGPSVRALVRNIHVSSRERARPDILELLLSWLPELSQLVSFSWDSDCSFPTPLLKGLAQHWPSTRLHMRTTVSKCNISKDWKVLRLAPSMIRTLQVCMPNDASQNGQKQGRVAKEKLLQVLNNCPGLQSLSTYGFNGYKERNYRFRRGPLAPSGLWHDAKLQYPLPQLLELSIADRTFEVHDLLAWGANEGWAKLKKITLWDHRLLYGCRGCENSLRSIILIDANEGYEDTLAEICLRTTRLTELKIRTGIDRLPLSALEICGHSLTAFAIHPQNDVGGYWTGVADVPVGFLKVIQRHCPELTSLAINLSRPRDSSSKHHLSALSRISRLTELTMHVSSSTAYTEHKSTLAAVEHTYRRITELGGTKQSLKSLILQDGVLPSDWDNPWGASSDSSRAFQATKSMNGGKGVNDLKVDARQIRGPAEKYEARKRHEEQKGAEEKTREYLDSMPPEILRKMIEDNSGQTHPISSGNRNTTYEVQTGGWAPKLAEYEERWKNSNGILPMLEWQLHKRKEQGWKLWDMPLMKADDGSEGFLYDRMIEAPADP